jgi:tryptophan synthase beta chain
MEMLGAAVVPVDAGTGTLKDATNEAMRHWAGCSDDTYYVIGSVMGPHPYPAIVAAFQRIIGDEVRAQILEAEGRLPSCCIACWGRLQRHRLFTAFWTIPTLSSSAWKPREKGGTGRPPPRSAAAPRAFSTA